MPFYTQRYSSTSSGKLLISGTDTTLGFAIDKILVGSGISVTQNNLGGNETLTIASTAVSGTYITEVPSGSGTSFTISHTPIAGTFQLYRGGAIQESVQSPVDYSISGTTITLALSLQSGETLIATYQY